MSRREDNSPESFRGGAVTSVKGRPGRRLRASRDLQDRHEGDEAQDQEGRAHKAVFHSVPPQGEPGADENVNQEEEYQVQVQVSMPVDRLAGAHYYPFAPGISCDDVRDHQDEERPGGDPVDPVQQAVEFDIRHFQASFLPSDDQGSVAIIYNSLQDISRTRRPGSLGRERRKTKRYISPESFRGGPRYLEP